MTLAIVDEARAITGGVDTHAGSHMAAALDRIGGLLGVQEFPATPDGYARLLAWLRGFGAVSLVGIEGTGSYGAGLSRHITSAGIRVVEVDRSDRQDRRRRASPTPSMRSAPPGRPSPGGHRGRPEDVMAWPGRSGR
jgi:transposase